MADQVLVLRHIDATSPTLAEDMRSCMLRAGLSRNTHNSEFVLAHPSAWLGVAYHEVLDKAGDIDPDSPDVKGQLRDFWDSRISELYQTSQQHPLNRKFGKPDTWPKYHITEQMAYLKATALLNHNPAAKTEQHNPDPGTREQFLSAYDGRLVGRPDVARGDLVLDYKSGYVLEASDGIEGLREVYVRQLRLYAYLIHENRGYWPRRGVVDPMSGGSVEIALDPTDCTREAMEAISLLDSYNSQIASGQSPEGLASASAESCRWCPFQSACPEFWRQVTPGWYESLHAAVVEGELLDTPQLTQYGAAFAVSMRPRVGTETADLLLLAPFAVSSYAHLERLSRGDLVRVVGAHRKTNGSLGTSLRTVVYELSSLPSIEIEVS